MRNETIAVYGGYENDRVTHPVNIPIYQTLAYAFNSADHRALSDFVAETVAAVLKYRAPAAETRDVALLKKFRFPRGQN